MPSLIGMLAASRVLATAWARGALFGTLCLAAVLLALFPQRYLATASLTPTDPDSLGLGGTLGQLGAINNVFGNQAAIEVALRVGRSVSVRDRVIARLGLVERIDLGDRIAAQRWLERRVTVRSLRGGIILVSLDDADPRLAQDVVGAYVTAIRDDLAKIARRQTAYKRQVLLELVGAANDRLDKAQVAYDRFRLGTRAAMPDVKAALLSSQIADIEATIQARTVELQTARQTYTDDHLTVKRLRAEIAALQGQLGRLRATGQGGDGTVGQVVAESSELYRRERELAVAKTLYEGYLRYLQGTAVEDMTSTAAVRVLEPPHIETARQVWSPAAAAGGAALLVWLAIEFYRLRPPLAPRSHKAGEQEAHGA